MLWTAGAGVVEPERKKNIHARAQTMAKAVSVTTKLGGRRLTRDERIR
jgi:hypothetical protein